MGGRGWNSKNAQMIKVVREVYEGLCVHFDCDRGEWEKIGL